VKKKNPYVVICENVRAKNQYIKRLREHLSEILHITGSWHDDHESLLGNMSDISSIARSALEEPEP
jgi:hypothetical protein